MIHGIGVDLLRIERVASALERFGERFARRVLADAEWPEFTSARDRGRFLAKRFAVKEAAAKALGTGIRGGVSLHDFVTDHDDLGRPLLTLRGGAARLAAERGVAASHLSISDEQEQVVAFVVLECGG